jgi:hypothetical protein
MGPHDWHSKKAVYIAPNDYDTAMSQMAEASSEMLEALPFIFPNFQGYFLFGKAHDFFRTYMGKSKHPVLNTERVVHPSSIECKWWDKDHQKVAVRQACQALSAATGLDFRHSNINNFDDVMPVSASMKRKSEERLDAAICREEEEVAKAARSEERLLDAAIRRVDEEERLEMAAAAARMKEMEEAAAMEEKRKEMQVAAAVAARRMEIVAFVINAGYKMYCPKLCSHVGCVKSVHAKGVCREHGPRCSHVGCDKIPHISGVCKEHGPRCSHVGCNKCPHMKGVCKDHGPRCSHVRCDKNVNARNVCNEHSITKK